MNGSSGTKLTVVAAAAGVALVAAGAIGVTALSARDGRVPSAVSATTSTVSSVASSGAPVSESPSASAAGASSAPAGASAAASESAEPAASSSARASQTDAGASPAGVRLGALSVTGSMTADAVGKVVRWNLGKIGTCRDAAVERGVKGGGRLSVRFVIDREGTVTTASNGGTDLKDEALIGCVVRAFSSMKFPAPGSGIAMVVCPVVIAGQ